ncbi:dextranase [Gluconobacter cerinus]|uniref:glycoside hydrolase family 66 protein n=1 Tax=Gluconobacter cerinus TaxID=38307 RepID=UPI001B8C1514|nr:glycoside hydrolase family 66 protein [Gluconobacter cerinus]MBS1021888.1 dextranase [Gluconobacter cerinus]
MQIIRTAIVALALLLPAVSHADPQLSGPLIQSINTDLSHYAAGSTSQIAVTLKNTTGATFTGTLSASVTGRGVSVGSPSVASVTGLANGATTTLTLQIANTPNVNWQGYFVDIVAADANGHQMDREATGIDVSSDWWTYPRQCWFVGAFTDWGGWSPSKIYGTPEADIKSLNAYKCNHLQVYNLLYRWHQPWINQDSWINGDGMNVSVPLLKRSIAAAKRLGMGTLFYTPIYSANKGIAPNFQNDGTGVNLAWAVFTNNCGATNSCTVADAWNFSTNIAIMNTQNPGWQKYWAQQAMLAKRALGFDGFFGDTYGSIQLALWDINGNRMNNDKMYSSFITSVTNQATMPMVINPAGSYMEQDLVQSGRELYHFDERWNNSSDIANFGTFLTKARQVWGWANRTPNNIGLDWDMGMNKTLGASSSCTINGGSTGCTFNTPGVLYQEAAILSTGAHHAWIVDGQMGPSDGARFISNDDYPISNMLSPKADMVQGEYDYQNFGVAYEKLLRLNISASTAAAPSITSGATGSTTAAAGSVWMFQNHRSGFDILHLLNYQQMSTASFNDVNDNAANAAAPTTTGALQLKMYYTSGGTLGDLYTASPDVNHGAPVKLSYATGSDSSGSYITFTLPSLKFWDMVWLENGVASSDYGTP